MPSPTRIKYAPKRMVEASGWSSSICSQEAARASPLSLPLSVVLSQLMTMYGYETELKRRYQESDSIIEHIITGLI